MGAVAVTDRKGAGDGLTALSARQITWLVFLGTLLLYFAFTPYALSHWWITGDEPHYLLVAHSVVTDGDIRVGNNYEEKDFLAFFILSDVDIHAAKGRDGELYPLRGVGFSLLLAPAYLIGGRAGVVFFLNLIAALLAANFYLLCYEVTRSKIAGLLGCPLIFLTPLVSLHAFMIYPEMVGALLLILGLRGLRSAAMGEGASPVRDWLLVGLSIALLPWLSARFIFLSGTLFLCALIYGGRRFTEGRGWLSVFSFLVPGALSGVLYLGFRYHLFGSVSPLASYAAGGAATGGLFEISLLKMGTGLIGWLLDQKKGLLIYSPIYILALPGILLMLAHRRREALPPLLCAMVVYLSLAWTGLWSHWEISARYLVVSLPIWGLFIVYAIWVVRSFCFRMVAGVLLAISLFSTYSLFTDPVIGYVSTIVVKYNRLPRIDVSRYIPALVPSLFLTSDEASREIGSVVYDLAFVDQVRWASNAGVTYSSTDEGEGYAFVVDLKGSPYFLPRGDYESHWFLKLGQGHGSGPVVRIDVLDPAGRVLAKREIVASDFKASGAYERFTLSFKRPRGDPPQGNLTFRVFFTGEGDLWLGGVEVDTVNVPSSWALATIWLAGILAFSGYYFARFRGTPAAPEARFPEGGGEQRWTFGLAVGALTILILASVSSYLHSLAFPRVYEGEGLPREVGQVVRDRDASGGRAVYATPDVGGGALAYLLHDFLPSGEYQAVFRMKVDDNTLGEATVAYIDVHASEEGVMVSQNLASSDFQAVGAYQDLTLDFRVPRQQAVQFRVVCLGLVDVWLDKVTAQRR